MICLYILIYVFLKTRFIVLLHKKIELNLFVIKSYHYQIAQYREQKQIVLHCIDTLM